jgi:DNA-directed RNA polymerase III subunit RPC2
MKYFLLNILYFRYLGSKTKQKRFFSSAPKKSPVDEARDLLATMVLAHVPVSYYVLTVHCLEE